MKKLEISRKRDPPFRNGQIAEVKNELQKNVNKSNQPQAVMRKARSQLSVRRSDNGTCEAATRTRQSGCCAEDADTRESDPSNLERGRFWSGRLYYCSSTEDERTEYEYNHVRD